MRLKALRRLLPLLLLIGAPGCFTATPMPEDAFVSLPDQTYSYDLVWECLVEAVETEEYVIDVSQRSGDEGDFTTEFKITGRDALSSAEEATKISARVRPVSEKHYKVQVAAAVFARQDENHDWSYKTTNPRLVDKVKSNYKKSVKRRYQPGS